jgi:cell division initiation protein
MALTPVDIQHIEFKTAIRGYSKSQVDDVMRQMAEALDEAVRDRRELQRRVEGMEDEVGRVKRMEAAISDALTLAQKTAEETRANAHKQAELILAEAEQSRVKMTVEAQKETERYRADIELLQATKERFEIEFRSLLEVYSEWLDRRGPGEVLHSEVA